MAAAIVAARLPGENHRKQFAPSNRRNNFASVGVKKEEVGEFVDGVFRACPKSAPSKPAKKAVSFVDQKPTHSPAAANAPPGFAARATSPDPSLIPVPNFAAGKRVGAA